MHYNDNYDDNYDDDSLGEYFTKGKLLENLGVEIVRHFQVGDYQGDDVYHVTQDGRHGFLVLGYGSCSFCDTIQYINELKPSEQNIEVAAYSVGIESSIKWFADAYKLADWANSYDFGGQFYGSYDDVGDVVNYFQNLKG